MYILKEAGQRRGQAPGGTGGQVPCPRYPGGAGGQVPCPDGNGTRFHPTFVGPNECDSVTVKMKKDPSGEIQRGFLVVSL
jgi:hypothetical protein